MIEYLETIKEKLSVVAVRLKDTEFEYSLMDIQTDIQNLLVILNSPSHQLANLLSKLIASQEKKL